MIDLCIDARMADSAGIGTCIRQIVPLLNAPPFKLKLIVAKPDQPWCSKIDQIVLSSPIYSIQEQIQLPLKIPRCDLFWSPHYNVPLLPIRAKKRVVTIHDTAHLALAQDLLFLERVYARFVMNHAFQRSDAVVTVSSFSKEELIRFFGYPKQDIQVIYNGVNPKLFYRICDFSSLEAVRKKYQLPSKFLLFVGSQKRHKNLKGLIEAYSLLQPSDLRLVIVGKRIGMRNVIDHIKHEHIYCLERVPDEDLAAIYSLAEIFIFPSLYEGFGFPPLEAMSCGCPTIVSNRASLPEVCKLASLYVNPDKPREIVETIDKILTNKSLRKRLIQNGMAHASSYTWSNTASYYRELFESLLIQNS